MSDSQLQYAAYTTAQQNTSKCKQVVMLYDGAMRFVAKAVEAIRSNNVQERYNCLERACTILLGLQSALDFERGGDVAHILDQYYHSIDMRLISVHRTNDIATCEKVISELQIMREAWEAVDQITARQAITSEHLMSVINAAKEREDTEIVPLLNQQSSISVDI